MPVPADSLTVNVAYTDPASGNMFQASFDVEVKPVVLESLEVTSPPTKTQYGVGEALDYTGLVVTGHYSNGTTRNLTAECTFSPAEGTFVISSGTITVEVSYGGQAQGQFVMAAFPRYGISLQDESIFWLHYYNDTADNMESNFCQSKCIYGDTIIPPNRVRPSGTTVILHSSAVFFENGLVFNAMTREIGTYGAFYSAWLGDRILTTENRDYRLDVNVTQLSTDDYGGQYSFGLILTSDDWLYIVKGTDSKSLCSCNQNLPNTKRIRASDNFRIVSV